MLGTNFKPTSTPAPAPSPSPSPARPASFASGTSDSGAGRTGGSGILSSDVSIKGDVTFKSELIIDGQVEGTIKSGGSLTVGQNAKIKADIEAGSVTIHGTVDGNITASERCALEPGATVRGDISAPRLALNENATFLGRASISTKRP